jgi:CTP synthase (UTP-ammonia lyase)
VCGLKNAGHTEEDPDAAVPLLILAACPIESRPQGAPRLWGGLKIDIVPGSLASRLYASNGIEETFTCNYELNPVYGEFLEKHGLKVSGTSADGGARIVELPGRRFFLATGFVPQMSSAENRPHPLITAFLAAAAEYANS